MSEYEFWKDLGNIFESILTYQKKNVEFNNRFINPWIRLGNIFERQDQNKEAVEAFKHAIEIDPDSSQNWVDLGDAQFKDGAYDDAIGSYQKAASLDPQAGWPLSNLALVLVTQGKHEEAIPLYRASIELLDEAKDKAMVWNRLGNAYRKLNDYENAFLSFQEADRLDSENTGFHDKLDETPTNVPVVAPEEVIEQMIVEQEMATETVAVQEEATPEPEAVMEEIPAEVEMHVIDGTGSVVQLDLPGDPIGIAPNEEMVVEEPEAVAEAPAVAEESPVEAVASITATEAVAEETVTIEEPAQEEAVAETTEVKASTEVDTVPIKKKAVAEEEDEDSPLVRHEGKFNALQIIEDIIAKVEANALRKEAEASEKYAADKDEEEAELAPETPVAPSWLVLPNQHQLNDESADATNEVTTMSELPQDVTISDSMLNMDAVETFTEDVAAQLTAETTLSEETVEEIVAQPEAEAEALVEESTEAKDEASDEKSHEAAYEEYLKDVVEPTAILSDHVDEIHAELPLTRVSESGEVRIVMDTKNAHVWNELGNVYMNSGAYEDAITAYSKAIELDRSFAWPYSNLALGYVQKGRFAEAILLYQRAIELFTSDKDKAITWNRLGNVYRRMNDYTNAISSYHTADELDPENTTLSLQSSFGLLGNIQPESKPAYIS